MSWLFQTTFLSCSLMGRLTPGPFCAWQRLFIFAFRRINLFCAWPPSCISRLCSFFFALYLTDLRIMEFTLGFVANRKAQLQKCCWNLGWPDPFPFGSETSNYTIT
ncbi:hypothetical protein L210DRAFT_2736661 [Boletus edulis BED1]|uniref:Uncharacterized protein n=1 Tax=Boletus edulis BED1 TaxID=1328754 RepID=A0AAD4BLA2_BOLED|nr:hypothetical protein L210DRAFT_2736661 [Boletus edulis BED1]